VLRETRRQEWRPTAVAKPGNGQPQSEDSRVTVVESLSRAAVKFRPWVPDAMHASLYARIAQTTEHPAK